MPRMSAEVADDGVREGWWSRPFRNVQTNLREVDAGLEVDAVLDFIQQHGADTWLLNTGGILSLYPTELPFQTRNPYLSERPSGDLIGDAVTAAHARGIRVLSRMDFSKVIERIAGAHPEWCYVAPAGHLQKYNGLVSVCPSGGYYQAGVFDVLDEVLDRYPVDGFFFNMFGFSEVDYSRTYHGPCHCASCVRAFAEYADAALPTGPDSPAYGRWRSFAAETLDDLANRIADHLARSSPNAGLVLSGRKSDIVYHEANNAVGRELWHHRTSEAVSAHRSHRPRVPVLVNSTAFLDMPYRMAGEQAEHFAQFLIQAISRGGNPSTYVMGVPGQIPYECLPIAGEITRFHARWNDVYDGMVPCARTGLVRPSGASRPRVPGTDDSRHAEAIAEFRGLYETLQQSHVPFDVVAQEYLESVAAAGELDRFALLVLPDLGPLAEPVAAALDGFVERGGRLLSTGSTALADEAVGLKSLPAVRRDAVRSGPDHLFGAYVAAHPDGAEERHTYPPPVLPIHGSYHYLSLRDGVKTGLTVLAQAPYGPPEKCYGQRPIDHPGYVIGDYGKGRTALIPWTIGRTYHDLGLTGVRDVAADLVADLLDGAEPVRADVSEQVEITVHRNAGDLVVHLVNLSGARRTNFGPPFPITGGTIRIGGLDRVVPVRALVADRACTVRTDGADLVVELPEINHFEVVVVSSADSEHGHPSV